MYIEENADKLLNIDRTEVSSDYLKLVDNTAFELLGLFFCSAQVPKLCPATRCHGIFQIYEENWELHISEGGNNVSDNCETIVIKFSGPNYLINGSFACLFWPRSATKKVAETQRAS